MYLTPINKEDVYKEIMSWRNTKSADYDSVSTYILKYSALYISGRLSHIINMSFLEGFSLTFKIVVSQTKKR